MPWRAPKLEWNFRGVPNWNQETGLLCTHVNQPLEVVSLRNHSFQSWEILRERLNTFSWDSSRCLHEARPAHTRTDLTLATPILR